MDRLEAMSLFLAVVDAGSLSAASRKMRMPLATVSRKISDLEAHLNARLLTRSNRRVAPTEAGRSFLQACRRIVQDVGEAERQASGEYRKPQGELILSAPIALGRLYLLPVVATFLQDHPSIDVRMVLADRRLNLVDERIDVALRVGELSDSSQLAKKVGAVRRVVCASPGYLARRGAPQDPGDLIHHDCITFENTISGHAWRFETGRSEREVPIHSRLIVSTAEAAIDAAVSGLGITRAIDYQINHLRQAGALTLILETFKSPPKPVHLIYSGGRHLPVKIGAFLDYATPRLKKAFRELANR
jgi:DNA-binding transcriptional LysR family regulator